MSRAKKEATILKEQQNKLLAEKLANKTDICRLSELTTKTIENFDCEILSISITEECQPLVDYLKTLRAKNIEFKQKNTGEYINIPLDNSWKSAMIFLLEMERKVYGIFGTSEEKSSGIKLLFKELILSSSIYVDYSGAIPIYAEEVEKGYYIYSTYSNEVIFNTIKRLIKIMNIDDNKTLIKLKNREQKEVQKTEEKQEERKIQLGRVHTIQNKRNEIK